MRQPGSPLKPQCDTNRAEHESNRAESAESNVRFSTWGLRLVREGTGAPVNPEVG